MNIKSCKLAQVSDQFKSCDRNFPLEKSNYLCHVGRTRDKAWRTRRRQQKQGDDRSRRNI